MGRELMIVWAGRRRRDAWDRMCRPYRERIERQAPLTESIVRVAGGGEGRTRRRAESKALLAGLPSPCWAVAVDRRGVSRSSRELADWLGRLRREFPHPIAFLLGSDVGLSSELMAATRDSLSFGPLTLPHELARLVLYEQLYRALSILAGMNYHRPRL
jgi:23S rRNA (pseudouridine1915-N3)-methyltransferase